jgi:hypothetical protein
VNGFQNSLDFCTELVRPSRLTGKVDVGFGRRWGVCEGDGGVVFGDLALEQ